MFIIISDGLKKSYIFVSNLTEMHY